MRKHRGWWLGPVASTALASCITFQGLTGGAADSGPTGDDASALDGAADAKSDVTSADGTDDTRADVVDAASEADMGPTGLAKQFIFAGYEGGPFTIDVDVDLPEIVLGLVAAQPLDVTVTGAFANNVTAVRFVGSAVAATGTKISGVAPSLVSVAAQPPAVADARGASTITCQYEGGARYSDGSCNTREQVEAYFKGAFGGTIVLHACQYSAYAGTKKLSAGSAAGTCSCSPTTCALEGKACGAYPDGCGGSLNCGGCAAGTCGGFGVANQCGGCAAGQTAAGPRSPTTVIDDASRGTRAWSGADSARVSDDARASIASMTNFDASHYLKATGFGFSVPQGATIAGVYLEVEHATDLPFESFVDGAVRIVNGNTIGATERKSAKPWAPSDLISLPKDHIAMYGGPNDSWGTSLTPGLVNSASFGAAVAVNYDAASGSGSASVDAMRMWICY